VFFYGIYLLTSIGLNITSRTRYYPVSTTIAAAVNIALNFLLVPSYGLIGAAWATGAAYAIQSGIAYHFSQRFYPIRYERGRIVRAVGAALLGYLVAAALPPMPAILGVLARGTTVVVVMALALWVTWFFRPGELLWLSSMRRAPRSRAPVTVAPDATEMAGEIVSVDVPDQVIARREQGVKK
jgi:O-antigen/teichoic acid export membrane protein